MPETIDSSHGVDRWLWHSIMKDLEEQGDLPGVVIDPLSVKASFCAGVTPSNVAFGVTWCYEEFLIVSMLVEVPELIEAFSKVVGYRPFCRYVENRQITFEWDKTQSADRFLALSFNPKITSLTRVD